MSAKLPPSEAAVSRKEAAVSRNLRRLQFRVRRLQFRVIRKLDRDREGDGICLEWLRSIALQGCSSILRNLIDREPFGFDHSLSGIDLFKFEELYALAEKYIGHAEDYYVACSAPGPDTVFFSVPPTPYLHAASRNGLLSRPLETA